MFALVANFSLISAYKRNIKGFLNQRKNDLLMKLKNIKAKSVVCQAKGRCTENPNKSMLEGANPITYIQHQKK